MPSKRLLYAFAATIFTLTGVAVAHDRDHGKHGEHDEDRDHGKHGDRDEDRDRHEDRDHHSYRAHDRDEMRGWYSEHHDHLPAGLAKRDQLPPGLERQLVVRGTLPPGLRKRIYHCPDDLERRLPPPPPECEHVLVGGHVVLLNRRTFLVVDVFHFEVN